MKIDRWDILMVVLVVICAVLNYVLLRWWCGLDLDKVLTVTAASAVFYAIIVVAAMVGRRT